MGVSLSKGGNVSLGTEVPGLKSIIIGLGWDTHTGDGQGFDLDVSAFLLGETGRVGQDADFIFYNNLRSADGSVEHAGDNRTGAGEGDDEALKINLEKIPAHVVRIVVVASIHEAEARKQNFGMVANAFIRVVNLADYREIARFDLSGDLGTETALLFGEIYRQGGDWKFKAVGQGHAGGLGPLARNYGVEV